MAFIDKLHLSIAAFEDRNALEHDDDDNATMRPQQ